MLVSLILPIVLTAAALFFASFLSWMVLQLHKDDFQGVPREGEIMDDVRKQNLAPGTYMFPHCKTHKEMQSPEFQQKYESGPRGVLTILPKANMGLMMGLTVLYFLVCSLGLAYLASVSLSREADFVTVFTFVFIAGVMTFLSAILPHAIWFRNRITGHVIESIAYAAITAAIFAAMWPRP